MKLIDGDALEAMIDSEMDKWSRYSQNYVRRMVSDCPDVDAIPVEWIRNIKAKLPDSVEKMGLDAVLMLWANEQGAG